MNYKKETYFHCCLGLLCAALLGACSSIPGSAGGASKASAKLHKAQLRQQRETTLQSMWNGKSYASLVEAMGMPSVVIEIPGRITQAASIYGMDEPTQCLDTFVVASSGKEMVVNDYFCR